MRDGFRIGKWFRKLSKSWEITGVFESTVMLSVYLLSFSYAFRLIVIRNYDPGVKITLFSCLVIIGTFVVFEVSLSTQEILRSIT